MPKFKLTPDQDFETILQNTVSAQVGAAFSAFRNVSKDAAQSGQTLAMQLATRKLRSTAQEYISALTFTQPDDGDLILNVTLDARATYLEKGYPRFDMKPGILKNAAVSKEGHRYQAVPFQHGGTSIPNELNRVVQIRQPMQTTRGSMLADLAQLKAAFAVPDTTMAHGKAATGKVWSIARSTGGPQWTLTDAVTGKKSSTQTIPDLHPNLAGITKIQYKTGKSLRSAYLTWRTASENPKSKNKFIHPGFGGARILEEVEKHMVQEINAKLAAIFQS